MPLIQITNTYNGQVLNIVRDCVPRGFSIRLLKENTKDALLSCVKDADYILASGRVPIDEDVLAQAPNLKMVQRTGVGLDSLDLGALQRCGIPLYINQGINAASVAEHALLLMLASLRKLPIVVQNTKNGVWKKQAQGVQTRELGKQTVGIVGMGNIGQRVAKLLNSFGAQVLYYDVFRQSAEHEQELKIRYVSLEELFKKADVITLHCPLTAQTKEIICAESIAKMKDGVVIVNTSRGGLVKEEDLTAALETGKVAFAGLDVFSEEPVKNTELLQQENLICTPHIAGVTYDSFLQMMQGAMRNIAFFEEGKLLEIEQYRRI